jgi:hypothetical protein
MRTLVMGAIVEIPLLSDFSTREILWVSLLNGRTTQQKKDGIGRGPLSRARGSSSSGTYHSSASDGQPTNRKHATAIPHHLNEPFEADKRFAMQIMRTVDEQGDRLLPPFN